MFRAVTDTAVGSHRDKILDFVHRIDTLDVRAIDADSKHHGNQAFKFVGSKELSHHAGELRYVSGIVSGDVNGDGLQIEITNHVGLTAGDFLL